MQRSINETQGIDSRQQQVAPPQFLLGHVKFMTMTRLTRHPSESKANTTISYAMCTVYCTW